MLAWFAIVALRRIALLGFFDWEVVDDLEVVVHFLLISCLSTPWQSLKLICLSVEFG